MNYKERYFNVFHKYYAFPDYSREQLLDIHAKKWSIYDAKYQGQKLELTEDDRCLLRDQDGYLWAEIDLIHKILYGVNGVTLVFIDDQGPTHFFPWDRVEDCR